MAGYVAVTNLNDVGPGSLRAALANASAGDTIVFDPSLKGGTITLASTLNVTTGVTIDGGALGITVSGASKVTDFTVNTSGSVAIENLTIADGHGVGANGVYGRYDQGGNAAGGILLQAGNLSLADDTFRNDTAKGGAGSYTGSGVAGGNAAGAVYVQGGTIVSASNLFVTGDSATGGPYGNSYPDIVQLSPGSAYPVSNSAAVTAASTYRVTSLADSGLGSLRAELAEAPAGATITFDPSLKGGTITLASTLNVTSGVTIDGGTLGITVSGAGQVTDFTVETSGSVTIENLTIADGHGVGADGAYGRYEQGGNAAGGILLQGGNLRLANDKFLDDTATGGAGSYTGSGVAGGNAAGAVYVQGGTIVSASNLFVSGDSATGGPYGNSYPDIVQLSPGSAYPVSNSTAVTAASTYLVTSLADAGPGSLRAALAEAPAGATITFDPSLKGGTITLASTLAVAKGVRIDGGAVGVTISGAGQVTDFTVDTSGNVTIENLTIADGHGVGATGSGDAGGAGPGGDAAGGIFLKAGALRLSHDVFRNDTAVGGTGGSGGPYPNPGVPNSTITHVGGAGGNAAGAVYVESGTSVTASSLTFSGDHATQGAGGPGVMRGSAGHYYRNSNSAAVAPQPCFAAGTRILADKGEVAVERLAVGDHVVTASGVRRPIVWIGRSRVDLTRHPRPDTVRPVRIAANALGEALPMRDLLLSPEHALCLEGALVPAAWLINGATIRQEAWSRVEYVHVELDSHDILLAEGVPAESYLDCDNRSGFDNARDGVIALHPDWSVEASGRVFAPEAQCARLRETFAVRAKVLGRAAEVEAHEAAQRARGRVPRTNVVRNPRGLNGRRGRLGREGQAPAHWWFDAPVGLDIVFLGGNPRAKIPYVDVRIVGRVDVASGVRLFPETTPAFARRGQDWTVSCFVRRVAGPSVGLAALALYVDEYGVDGAYVAGQAFPQSVPTSDDLALNRAIATHRVRHPEVAATAAYLTLDFVAHQPVDVTLRLAGMQFEAGDYASDLILPPLGEIGQSSRTGPTASPEAVQVA